MTDKRLFCFGYGYTADFLGRALKERGGWSLSGTTRTIQKRSALRAAGVDAYIFDDEKPLHDPFQMMQDTTHLLISTPPGQDGDFVYLTHEEEIARLPKLEWVGYLSTLGVYGDRDGAFVDEKTELRPSSIRGTRRVRAEGDWQAMYRDRGVPSHIFRLAGIYGPGRSAIDSVKAGIARRILKPGHAFSRVHVDDIIATILASFEKPNPGSIYNVVDDEAAPSHEVIAYACRLLGRDPPPLVPFDEANLSPMSLSFYSENKRVKNDKIKTELGVELKYPNYRVGLEACLKSELDAAENGGAAPWALQVADAAGGSF